MSAERERVTGLLQEWQAGRREALDELMPLVHDPMLILAKRQLRGQPPGHTLSETELVQEVLLRLFGSNVAFEDATHFYAVVSSLMRLSLASHGSVKR